MIETYSERGRMHIQAGEENQDALAFQEKKAMSVIVLADGVSSCTNGGEGARCAANTAARLLERKGNSLFGCSERETAEFVTSQVVYQLGSLAEQQNRPAQEYASTLSAVCFDRSARKLLYLNLGDCMILSVHGEECKILSHPSDSTEGCCVTTTENAVKEMYSGVADARTMDAVYILSDGAWRVLFDSGRLKADARTILQNLWYEDLREYLRMQNCEDDHSFISIDMKTAARRKKA